MNTIIIRFILTPFLQVLLLTKKIYYDEKKVTYLFFSKISPQVILNHKGVSTVKKGDKK